MKTISLIISILLVYTINAQMIVGSGSSVTTNKNLIKIKDDNTKGVVLTKNTTNFHGFPRYNVNTTDLFNDYSNLIGSIIYNIDDDQYYKYDGYAWNPARQIQAIHNPTASRVGATSGFTKLCVGWIAGLCLAGSPPVFKMEDNPSAVLEDNLNIKTTSDFATISTAGVYDLVAAVNITGLTLGAAAGVKEYKLSMQARSGSNGEWETIAQKKSYTVILIIEANGTDTSFVHTAYLPANTELRVMVEILTTSADFGQVGGATTDLDPIKTYLAVRRVR